VLLGLALGEVGLLAAWLVWVFGCLDGVWGFNEMYVGIRLVGGGYGGV